MLDDRPSCNRICSNVSYRVDICNSKNAFWLFCYWWWWNRICLHHGDCWRRMENVVRIWNLPKIDSDRHSIVSTSFCGSLIIGVHCQTMFAFGYCMLSAIGLLSSWREMMIVLAAMPVLYIVRDHRTSCRSKNV